MAQNNQQNGNNSNRGFASMDQNKQREIAAEGGRASHASGNAHEFSSEEARRAGSQSHKNDGNLQSGSGNRGSGNSHDEHVRAGSQSHKNEGNLQSGSGNRGGGNSHEEHVRAGSQSHKNDKR